jgi:hypothetical protein
MTEPRKQPEIPPENVIAFKKRQEPPKPRLATPEQADEDRARSRTNLAALVLAAVLVFFGWLLVHELGKSSRMQDCLMSGRTNCAPIEAPTQNR